MPGYFVDTSVWVAGSFESHPHFPLADSFLVGPQRAEAVWLARVVENSFLRLITTAVLCRSYDSPVVGNLQAVEILYHLGCLPLSVSPSIDVPTIGVCYLSTRVSGYLPAKTINRTKPLR